MKTQDETIYTKSDMLNILCKVEEFLRMIYTEDRVYHPSKVLSVTEFFEKFIYCDTIPTEISGKLLRGFVSLYVEIASPDSDLKEKMYPLINWGMDYDACDHVKHTYHKSFAKYVERVYNYTGQIYLDPTLGIYLTKDEDEILLFFDDIEFVDVVDSDCASRVMCPEEVDVILKSEDYEIVPIRSNKYRHEIFSVRKK